MIKINRAILYFIIILFLHSCGTMSDAGKTLRNEKIKTTDEFLVKKRQPLSLPPDYENLPKPNSKDLKDEKNSNEINNILKIPKKQTTKQSSTTVEQSIIDKIRK
ncbi:MAG: hypothetical protein CMI71_03585 [Candidatus Pelagibacter sp.]|nr:hypothetical protein [Candidatus Pelagibacter sp.]|tara:strand:+ start:1725 stop:2039 length:315 start_codon:yes stop_codon:yes gene_type:complete